MGKNDYPVTPAVRLLRSKDISFEPHIYAYKDHGGTAHAAASIEAPEHAIIKTLVFETDAGEPLIVLMHGDYEVSTKELARTLRFRSVLPSPPDAVQKHTGYMVGGVSPFGTRKGMRVYAERTIFDLQRIYINGGKRGFLVELDPHDLQRALPIEEVAVGIVPR